MSTPEITNTYSIFSGFEYPMGSYKRITYPIPANDPIQFIYLFCNLITKTFLLERGRIVAMKETAFFQE